MIFVKSFFFNQEYAYLYIRAFQLWFIQVIFQFGAEVGIFSEILANTAVDDPLALSFTRSSAAMVGYTYIFLHA